MTRKNFVSRGKERIGTERGTVKRQREYKLAGVFVPIAGSHACVIQK